MALAANTWSYYNRTSNQHLISLPLYNTAIHSTTALARDKLKTNKYKYTAHSTSGIFPLILDYWYCCKCKPYCELLILNSVHFSPNQVNPPRTNTNISCGLSKNWLEALASPLPPHSHFNLLMPPGNLSCVQLVLSRILIFLINLHFFDRPGTLPIIFTKQRTFIGDFSNWRTPDS